jgi:hypothetical protein
VSILAMTRWPRRSDGGTFGFGGGCEEGWLDAGGSDEGMLPVAATSPPPPPLETLRSTATAAPTASASAARRRNLGHLRRER